MNTTLSIYYRRVAMTPIVVSPVLTHIHLCDFVLSEPDEYEKPDLQPDAVDLGDYHIIGGVIRFDLLTLPRQPKCGNGWTITTCVRPPKLTPFEYNVDGASKPSISDNSE